MGRFTAKDAPKDFICWFQYFYMIFKSQANKKNFLKILHKGEYNLFRYADFFNLLLPGLKKINFSFSFTRWNAD